MLGKKINQRNGLKGDWVGVLFWIVSRKELPDGVLSRDLQICVNEPHFTIAFLKQTNELKSYRQETPTIKQNPFSVVLGKS